MPTDPEIPYVTREMVQAVAGYADVPRLNARVDAACLSASREVERTLHRRFYPWTGTRTFNMPTGPVLWLLDSELAEAPTAVLSGTSAMTAADYFLNPITGPPYGWIETNTSGTVPWQAGATAQRSISITGTFNHPATLTTAGVLDASALAAASALDVNTSADLGTGSLLRIDNELMLVTERTLISTGTTLASDLTASKSVVTVPVASGAAIDTGEILAIDGERMLVQSVAGNTLTVERGALGSVLAAHTSGATVYAPRRCTVTRGILGTTAASHDDAAVIWTVRAPSLVQEYALALAVNTVAQGAAGWSRTLGTQDNRRDSSGAGLKDVMEAAYTAYGRKVRSRAVGS